ncbi:MAG: lytic transglycosylase domain-containing protein [Treponema sp.]
MQKKAVLFLPAFLILFSASASALSERSEYKDLFSYGVNKNEVKLCLENGRKTHTTGELCRILKDSVQYRAYIRKRLKEENMPACIEYLPLIESNYKPTAKPANGESMGIWQFMPNSVFPFMELSEYVDERRDPWVSTDSALKKLKENYALFNDWLLALAAYNCGSGAVTRALEKSEEKNFSSLCRQELIPNHAIQYVPNFLKIADLIENALFYEETKIYEASCIYDASGNAIDDLANLSEREPDPTFFYYDFDYITVTESISLKALAKELRLDYQILKNLNLSLVKEKTPPDRKYRLRLPAGMALSCKDALFAINNRQKNTENKKENLNSN